MNTVVRKIWVTIHSSLFFIMVGSLGVSQSLQAGSLDISQMPLFLNQTVAPNVFFELDDSGSMDWEILTTQYWHACNYDNNAYGNPDDNNDNDQCHSSMETDGYWDTYAYYNSKYGRINRNFTYIFNNSDHAYSNNSCGKSSFNRLERCGFNSTQGTADWRVYSSNLNVMYYNPQVTYKPWSGICGDGNPGVDNVECTDADFDNARSNPHEDQAGYDLRRPLDNFFYNTWIDNRGYGGVRPLRGQNPNVTGTVVNPQPNQMVDLWDSYQNISFSGNTATIQTVDFAPDQNGLNPVLGTPTSVSGATCHEALGPSKANCGSRTVAEAKQNIANWYQYYRRRMYVVKAAISEIMQSQPSFRFGMGVINEYDELFVEMPDKNDISYADNNISLLRKLYSFRQPAMGTPLRQGLERVGLYYQHGRNGIVGEVDSKGGGNDKDNNQYDNPIIYECQKNFSILFTDGHYNGRRPYTSAIDDNDGDNTNDTLGDIAKHFYDIDLSGLANEVPADAFDDATHQHMVTFTAALGVFGDLEDTTSDGWPNINNNVNHTLNESGQVITVDTGATVTTGTGGWGRAYDGGAPELIDDMWHAAYNSRARFAAARNPQELADTLVDAISNIQSRLSSSSAVALNSGTLNENSRVYQARFDSTDWTGNLESIPISDGSNCGNKPKGSLCDVEWEASEILKSKNAANRNIHTSDPNKPVDQRKIAFEWANLSDEHKAILDTNPDTGVPDGKGESRLEFLRGDESLEGSEFRVRSGNKLGDIINSSPIFVGAPIYDYSDSYEIPDYSEYRIDKEKRDGVVYVGSNDGMLHAFDANSGEEIYAYIHSTLFPKLGDLTSQSYSHQYYVNGTTVTGDAVIGGRWGSYLVSSLGAGGQGLFVLDVTNPNTLDSTSLMWEVRDDDPVNDFSDVGNIMGAGRIIKLYNGDWAVIFGNGYNSTEADGSVGSGDAKLYIVNLADGNLIVPPISTGFGSQPGDDPLNLGRPNGLGEPTAVDIDGDQITDYIYGADLFGNIWKFDVRGGNESSWGLAFGARTPLFTASDDDSGSGIAQPIVTAVTVAPHPTNRDQSMVFFGTGKYFEVGDNTVIPSEQTQTFYGVYDKHEANHNSLNRNTLVQQKILKEEVQSGRLYRRVSHPDDGAEYKIDWTRHNGWLMNLVNTDGSPPNNMGERVIVTPFIRGNRVIFITLIPSDNPCHDGGDGWIMELDYRTGGRLAISPFDVNNDGIIDSSDIFLSKAYGGAKVEGIPTTPGVLNDPSVSVDGGAGGELKVISTSRSGDNIDVIKESSSPSYSRSSWRQIK